MAAISENIHGEAVKHLTREGCMCELRVAGAT
jgi:hypothetical protein